MSTDPMRLVAETSDDWQYTVEPPPKIKRLPDTRLNTELIAAAKENLTVHLWLDFDTDYADEDGSLVCKICHAGPEALLVSVRDEDDIEHEIWVSRRYIASYQIIPA